MKNIYEQALAVQDASNISGVTFAFEQVMEDVNQEMHDSGGDESYRRHHPAVILFLDKLVSLAGGFVQWSNDDYSMAYEKCTALSSSKTAENTSKTTGLDSWKEEPSSY